MAGSKAKITVFRSRNAGFHHITVISKHIFGHFKAFYTVGAKRFGTVRQLVRTTFRTAGIGFERTIAVAAPERNAGKVIERAIKKNGIVTPFRQADFGIFTVSHKHDFRSSAILGIKYCGSSIGSLLIVQSGLAPIGMDFDFGFHVIGQFTTVATCKTQ